MDFTLFITLLVSWLTLANGRGPLDCQKTIFTNGKNLMMLNGIPHVEFTEIFSISKSHESVCLINANQSLEIKLRLVDEYEYCQQPEFLYYIPVNPQITCEARSVCNYFNKVEDDCQQQKPQRFMEQLGIDTSSKIKEDSNFNYGCKVETYGCWWCNSATWWKSTITNPGSKYFRVEKCSSTLKTIKIEISVKSPGFVGKKILTFMNTPDWNTNVFGDNIIYIDSEENNENSILEKCTLTNSQNQLAVVDSCNNIENVKGKVGEIRCDKLENIETLKNCTFVEGIVLTEFNGGELTCSVHSLNYQEVFNKGLIPFHTAGYSVSVYEGYDITNYKLHHNTFSVKVTLETRIPIIGNEDTCQCIIHQDRVRLSDFYNDNKVHHFSLHIGNKDYSNVKILCEDENIIISETLLNHNHSTLSYYAYSNNINTNCSIFCNQVYVKNITIIAKFVELSHTDSFNKVSKTHTLSLDINDKGLFKAIMEFISDHSYSITFIITVVIIIVVIIALIFGAPQVFAACITTCCSKKQKIIVEKEQIPLQEIKSRN